MRGIVGIQVHNLHSLFSLFINILSYDAKCKIMHATPLNVYVDNAKIMAQVSKETSLN